MENQAKESNGPINWEKGVDIYGDEECLQSLLSGFSYSDNLKALHKSMKEKNWEQVQFADGDRVGGGFDEIEV